MLTIRDPGVLHLEPEGTKLRWNDAGAALDVLADSLVAAFAAEGGRGGPSRSWARGLMLLALAISVLSVGYAMRNPWSHPWILDAPRSIWTCTR